MKEKMSLPQGYYHDSFDDEVEDALVRDDNLSGVEVEANHLELLPAYPNIEADIKESDLAPTERQLFRDIVGFCVQTCDFYSKGFGVVLSRYAERKGEEANAKIIDFVKRKRLDQLRFRLLKGEQAEGELERFYARVGAREDQKQLLPPSDHFLLVLNLPKPIAKFWWKGGSSDNERVQQMGERIMEWGRLYRLLMPYIWHCVSSASSMGYRDDKDEDNFVKGQRFLSFDRVGCIGHDPNEYYYVYITGWEK